MSLPYQYPPDSQQPQNNNNNVVRRLELSVDPDNGSLLTAPLTHVLLSVTDALYRDLYNMAHGELTVLTGGGGGGGATTTTEDVQAPSTTAITTKRERMANLSFAQRRHELQYRLHQHGQCLQHVAALTATHAHSKDWSASIHLSSQALQQARTAWRQADEAQDALYFFHAQLFHSRASPHDIYGSLDVLLAKQWYDLPLDLRLDQTDRYPHSSEALWSKAELDQRWHIMVRNKLVRGEVGYSKRKGQSAPAQLNSLDRTDQSLSSPSSDMWKLSLNGGIVTLTHGTPKSNYHSSSVTGRCGGASTTNQIYPITALLTVLSSPVVAASHQHYDGTEKQSSSVSLPPPWTLLSLEVNVQAKTGEFHHQLEPSLRQRYDLHRLAVRAMAYEERQYKQRQQEEVAKEQSTQDATNGNLPDAAAAPSVLPPPRPLQALFEVAQTFLLSWQLELLSAQAQALRRGVWALGGTGGIATSTSSTANATSSIHVTPVQFFSSSTKDSELPLGMVSISFWKVDDSYGPPSMGDLQLNESPSSTTNTSTLTRNGGETTSSTAATAPDAKLSTKSLPNYIRPPSHQFTLTIRAKVNVGIIASLSGFAEHGAAPHENTNNVGDDRRTADESLVQDIWEATCNPLALSVSDALLAATRWCADRKCRAVTHALLQQQQQSTKHNPLPPWIQLSVEPGCIAVAAHITYHGVATDANSASSTPTSLPILFRLLCDARTGSFVVAFPRPCHLLRHLACNDVEASESMLLRLATLPQNRRRTANATASGRMVRDAFDGLIRSMNVLGQRTGVGGSWDNLNDESPLLRERSIQLACSDVKTSLVKSCGMAALYGLAAVALGGALGLDAVADSAGEALASVDDTKLLPVPPLGALLDQQLVETTRTTSDGVIKKEAYIAQTLFSVSCSVNESNLTLYPLDVKIRLDSPTTAPQRTSCALRLFQEPPPSLDDSVKDGNSDNNGAPPPKKARYASANGESSRWAEDIMTESGRLAEILAYTVDPNP